MGCWNGVFNEVYAKEGGLEGLILLRRKELGVELMNKQRIGFFRG